MINKSVLVSEANIWFMITLSQLIKKTAQVTELAFTFPNSSEMITNGKGAIEQVMWIFLTLEPGTLISQGAIVRLLCSYWIWLRHVYCGNSKILMKTNGSGVPICPLKPNSVWGILLTFLETSSSKISICINLLSEISLHLPRKLDSCFLQREKEDWW